MGTGADSLLDALNANPTSVAALRAAVADDGVDPVDALDVRARSVGDDEAARIWLAIAERWATEPSRRRKALTESARHAWAAGDLFDVLESTFRTRGDREALDVFLRERADSGDETGRASAHDELARLAIEAGDDRTALSEYEALGMLGPDHAEAARAGFARLLERGADPAEIGRAEEALARRTNDERGLLRTLDERLARAPDDDGERLTALSIEVATLALKVSGDPNIAFDYARRLRDRLPHRAGHAFDVAEAVIALTDPPLDTHLGWLRELAAELERWQSVVDIAGRQLAAEERPYRRAALMIAVADAQANHLNQVDAALIGYEEAAVLDTAAAQTVRDRLDALSRTVEGDDVERVAKARTALLRLTRDWASLHGALMQEISEVSGPRRSALLSELADLQATQLGRPDLAAISLSEAVADALRPLRDKTYQALAELLDEPSARSRAAATLLPHYEESNAWSGLARTLDIVAEDTTDPAEAAALHHRRSAVLHERLDDLDGAVDAAMRAAELLPADTGFADRLRALLREAGRYNDALGLLNRHVDQTSDRERIASLEVERSRLLESATGGSYHALEAIWAARSRQPDSKEIDARFEELLRADDGAAFDLARRLADGGEAESAQSLLWAAARASGLKSDTGASFALSALECWALEPLQVAQLRTAIDRRDRADEWRRMHEAMLSQDISEDARRASRIALAELVADTEPDVAVEHLRDVAADRPADDGVYERLIALARDLDDPALLAEALEAALERRTLEHEVAVAALEDLLELYVVRLGRSDLGFAVTRRLLALEATHSGAIEFVEAYADEHDDPRLRYDALAECAPGIEDSKAHGRRHLLLAEIASESLGEPTLAAEHWLAAADEHGLDATERIDSARRAIEIGFAHGLAPTVLDAFEAELPLLEQDDDQVARSEELIDRLQDAGEQEAAFRLAGHAATAMRDASPGVLDRHAQLAQVLDRAEEAISSLTKWSELGAEEMPLDRLAQLAMLCLRHQPAADVGWERAAEVMLVDPDYIDLVLQLEGMTDQREQVRQLAANLAERSEPLEPRLQVRILHRAANLVAHEEAAEAAAETYWRKILTVEPTEPRAMESLQGVLRERGDGEGVTELLRGRLDHLDDDEARAAILREIAELAPNDEELESRNVAVLEVDIGDVDARLTLADLYLRTERPERAVEMLEEAAQLETDTARAKEHLWEVSRIAVEALEDSAKAAEALETLLDIDPLDATAIAGVEEIYRQDERWDDLCKTLERRVGLADSDDEKVRLHREAALLREERLDDLPGAVEALERVVTLEPANLTVLEKIASLHQTREDWDALILALDRIATTANIPELRREMMLRAAPILHEKLERHKDALDLLAQFIDAKQPDEDQRTLLRETAEQTNTADGWRTWAGAARKVALREDDEERRETLVLEIAHVLDQKLDEPMLAVPWLIDELARRPRLGAVLERLETLAAERDLEAELVDTYKLLASTFPDDPDTLWHALHRSAEIAERVVGHPEVAFDILRRAAETEELRERTDAEMRRIATEYDLWETYREFLAEEAENRAGSDAEIDLLVARAAVEESQIDDWRTAFETLLAGYQIAPFDERVREPLFRLAGEHDAFPLMLKLLEVLQEGAEPEERVSLLTEMADIYEERLRQPDQALSQHVRAWQVDPTSVPVREALEARALRLSKAVDLLAAYEWHAKQPGSPGQQVDAIRRAAQMAASIGLHGRMVALFERLVELSGEAEAPAVIAECDELMSGDGGDRSHAVELVERAARGLRRPSIRASLWAAAGDIATELDDRERAVNAYEAALADAPKSADTRAKLVDHLRALGRWRDLVEQLEATLATTPNPEAAAPIARELKRIYLEELGDAERSTTMALKALQASPDDPTAREEYTEQLRQLERWPELVEHHLATADKADDIETIVAERLAAAAIAEEYLDDPRRSVRIVDGIIAKVPGQRDALEIRARALAALGRWKEHIESLELLAAACDGADRAAVWAQAASVLEHQLFYSDRALDAWRRAVESDPTFGQGHAEAGRLLAEASRFEDAAIEWETAADRFREAEKPSELADALVGLAACIRSMEPDSPRIIGLLRDAVEHDSGHAAARAMYEDELRRSGDVTALLGLLDAELEAAGDDGERALILTRRAHLCYFGLENEPDALKAIERATELCPASRGPYATLGDIHLAAGRWAEAADAYARALGDDEDVDPDSTLAPTPILDGEAVDRSSPSVVYQTRAAIANERAGRIVLAQDLFATANLDDDEYALALVGLARLALRRSNPDGAAIYVAAFRANPHDQPPELLAEVDSIEASIREH